MARCRCPCRDTVLQTQRAGAGGSRPRSKGDGEGAPGREGAAPGGGTCLTERGEMADVFVSLFNSVVIQPGGLVWGNRVF